MFYSIINDKPKHLVNLVTYLEDETFQFQHCSYLDFLLAALSALFLIAILSHDSKSNLRLFNKSATATCNLSLSSSVSTMIWPLTLTAFNSFGPSSINRAIVGSVIVSAFCVSGIVFTAVYNIVSLMQIYRSTALYLEGIWKLGYAES